MISIDRNILLPAVETGNAKHAPAAAFLESLQDREDDALIGIRSSARALGGSVKPGVAIFYALALLLWSAAIWQVRPQMLALAALLPAAIHFTWQVASLRVADGSDALAKFRSNRFAGLLVALAMATVGASA